MTFDTQCSTEGGPQPSFEELQRASRYPIREEKEGGEVAQAFRSTGRPLGKNDAVRLYVFFDAEGAVRYADYDFVEGLLRA